MSNDVSSVLGTNQASAGTLSRVQAVSPVKNNPEDGNNMPAKAAIPERDIPSEKKIDAEKLDKAVRDINKSEQVVQREIHFSIDEESDRIVVKIMDLATKEVIRQMPNEEALNFARKLSEGEDLNLIDQYT